MHGVAVDRVLLALAVEVTVDRVGVGDRVHVDGEAVRVAEALAERRLREREREGVREGVKVVVGLREALGDGDGLRERVRVERDGDAVHETLRDVRVVVGVGGVALRVPLAEKVRVGTSVGVSVGEADRERVRVAPAGRVTVAVGVRVGGEQVKVAVVVADRERDRVGVGEREAEGVREALVEGPAEVERVALREREGVPERVPVEADGVLVAVGEPVKVRVGAPVALRDHEALGVQEVGVGEADGGERVGVAVTDAVVVAEWVAEAAGVVLRLVVRLLEPERVWVTVRELEDVRGRLRVAEGERLAVGVALTEGERLGLQEGLELLLALGAVGVVLGVGGVRVALAEGAVGVRDGVTVPVRVEGTVSDGLWVGVGEREEVSDAVWLGDGGRDALRVRLRDTRERVMVEHVAVAVGVSDSVRVRTGVGDGVAVWEGVGDADVSSVFDGEGLEEAEREREGLGADTLWEGENMQVTDVQDTDALGLEVPVRGALRVALLLAVALREAVQEVAVAEAVGGLAVGVK